MALLPRDPDPANRHAFSPGSSARDSGLLIIDKPEGMTSFDVVAKIRRSLHVRKVGHCGTLDPFATGVLLICVNLATRIVDQLSDQDKVYRFTVRFGVETDTLDKTGQVVRCREAPPCGEEQVREALDHFRGSYLQKVPRYSAVKVQGRRLYALSRSGVDVGALPSREVRIHALTLQELDWPEAGIEVHCSKGTYVRQLAADIGDFLGCGGHVTGLRRLASGRFGIVQATAMEELGQLAARGIWQERLISLRESLIHLPSAVLEDEPAVKQLLEGQMDPAWEADQRGRLPEEDKPVCILDRRGELVALWWPHPGPGQKRKLRVFRHSTEP